MVHRSETAAPEIEWLYGLQHLGVKLGLENIRALLDLLDHPEGRYSSVIVAGTNGKGSVAAMLHSMLQAAGIETGLFTSPHLMHPNERIRIGTRDIDTPELLRRLGHLRETIDEGLARGKLATHPSFFEVVTATALEAFRDAHVGAAVLEVGLGGRLDATNAVPADISVVVSVDLDHMESLGPTIERIAVEKAGVVKPGKPVVSGVARQQAATVLQQACRARGATLVDARIATRLVADEAGSLSFETERGRYPDVRLGLAGRHQIDNARVALSAFELFAEHLQFEPRAETVRSGLAGVRWPGRLQWIDDPLGGPPMLIDGAHNLAGARTVARHVAGLGRARPVLLFGAMRDKPSSEILDLLGPLAHAAVLTRPSVPRAEDPENLVPAARRSIAQVEVRREPEGALARARELAGPDRFILVTGSLYLVGNVLGLLDGCDTPGPVAL